MKKIGRFEIFLIFRRRSLAGEDDGIFLTPLTVTVRDNGIFLTASTDAVSVLGTCLRVAGACGRALAGAWGGVRR